MFCPKCGKEISKDSKFCTHCGHQITNEVKDAEVRTATVHPEKSEAVPVKQTHKQNHDSDLSIPDIIIGIIAWIFSSAKNIILAVLAVIAVIGFFFGKDPSRDSISKIKKYTCKDFMSMSQNDRLEVGNRLHADQYNSVSSFGGANMTLNLEYLCENKPETTLGEISR